MYGMYTFAEKLNVQNCVNWTGNCIHNMFEMSGFAKKSNIQVCENVTGNFVHYICGECLDLLKNGISRTA